MSNHIKLQFLNNLQSKYGKLKKISNSLSLYDLPDYSTRIYIRYSKIHKKNITFYGLREQDLKELEGKNSFIVFLWDSQLTPLFLPYSEYEEIFNSILPASDGQYKVQIYLQDDCTILYISNVGRFNIESYLNWDILKDSIKKNHIKKIPDFSHSQIQTLLGYIGFKKGFDIWIPLSDRNKLDQVLTPIYELKKQIPTNYNKIINIINEIDVIWFRKGSPEINSLYEVEHSTPIYSGLLRFNDLHLTENKYNYKYSIVSNDERKSLFFKQIKRPTFEFSGLIDKCNFLDYKDVYLWFSKFQ